jgi:hypothetical protein
MKRTVWTFGLLSGGILSAMMLLTMPFVMGSSIGMETGMVIGYTTMVLAFLLVFFGVRSYRDNVGGGQVGFGRALAVGSLIVLVASVCYVATWELIYFKLNPEYAEGFRTAALERAREEGGTPAQVERRVAQAQVWADRYDNPAINAAITFVEPLPVGLIVVLVSAGILSRARRREEDAGMAAVPG